MSPRSKLQFEEIRNEKKQLILSTTLKLFANNGYYSTSISKIAKEAKISKGLMYNYFESKESLLIELFKEYINMISMLINPNNDEEITSEEMSSFFDLLKKSLIEKSEYWRLFTRLSLQQEVYELLLNKISINKPQIRYQKLLYKYFAERFENAELEIFYFSSLIKGFTLQYAYASEMFDNKIINEFLGKLKEKYIIKKLTDK
jgi:AcrR family transcriptional regulator